MKGVLFYIKRFFVGDGDNGDLVALTLTFALFIAIGTASIIGTKFHSEVEKVSRLAKEMEALKTELRDEFKEEIKQTNMMVRFHAHEGLKRKW